jgi:hypothetical protein
MRPHIAIVGMLLVAIISGPAQAAAAPSFSISDATANEDAGQICFAVRKHGTLNASPSTLTFSQIAGTASAGSDYAAQTVTITFQASETLRSACVPLVNDTNPEPTETFTARLKAGANARLYDGTATGTITDTDVPPPPTPTLPTFTCQDVAVPESAGSVTVTCSRSGGNGLPTSIQFATGGGNIPAAAPNVDYRYTGGSITVAADAPGFTIQVPILEDTAVEGDETFGIVVIAASNGKIARQPLVTIKDNDAAPLPPVQCPDGSTVTSPATCPTGDIPSPSLTGLAPIADNFDTMAEIQASGPAPSEAPDLGAFRFQCGPGQIAKDDPIVYPGQPGRSHTHQFFGNTLANANSTYASLRTTGESTCMSKLNRSGYWVPALKDGKGHIVRPDIVTIYYKRWPKKDPHCNSQGGYPTTFNVEGLACLDLPNGLLFIFGFNMLNPAQAPTGAVQFMCEAQLANFETMTQALDRCRANPNGAQHFIARIEAPNCWDGHRLDSADHRSHVAYASYGGDATGMDGWGYPRCPATHPYVIPTFTMNIQYTIDNTVDDTHLWHFSSDEMVAGAAPGTTFHGDWFGAWSPVGAAMWQVEGCIENDLSCNTGNLGNGYGMKNLAGVTFNTANPRLVPDL